HPHRRGSLTPPQSRGGDFDVEFMRQRLAILRQVCRGPHHSRKALTNRSQVAEQLARFVPSPTLTPFGMLTAWRHVASRRYKNGNANPVSTSHGGGPVQGLWGRTWPPFWSLRTGQSTEGFSAHC